MQGDTVHNYMPGLSVITDGHIDGFDSWKGLVPFVVIIVLAFIAYFLMRRHVRRMPKT